VGAPSLSHLYISPVGRMTDAEGVEFLYSVWIIWEKFLFFN